jgi:hypothetical protein
MRIMTESNLGKLSRRVSTVAMLVVEVAVRTKRRKWSW